MHCVCIINLFFIILFFSTFFFFIITLKEEDIVQVTFDCLTEPNLDMVCYRVDILLCLLRQGILSLYMPFQAFILLSICLIMAATYMPYLYMQMSILPVLIFTFYVYPLELKIFSCVTLKR